MTVTDVTHDVVEQVVSLPIELVVPDPANPRDSLRDIPELVASIKARVARGDRGLLEPVHVRLWDADQSTTDGVERYMIVRGHRRLAGCQGAELSHIDAIVVSAEQADRIRASDRLVENLQRDDFTATEQARAVQQMLDLGMTPDEVAGDTALTVDQVNQASTVAGSKGVALVTKRFDISMDQAAALAEFDGDKAVFKELSALVVDNPTRFDHRVAQYRRDRKEHEVVQAAAPEWSDKGYKVLAWADAQKSPVLPLHAIKPTKGNANHMTVLQHADCPYRAVVLQLTRGTTPDAVEVEHYCTDPAKAGHDVTAKRNSWGGLDPIGAAGASKPKTEKEQREGRIHRAGMAASRAAADVRREFVRSLLTGLAAKGLVPFVVEQLAHEHSGMESRMAPMFGELTGATGRNSYHGNTEAQQAFLKKCRGRELMLLLARVCAAREWGWESNSWASTSDECRLPYLRFLVVNGYTPSTVEQVLLGNAKGSDVLAEMDRVKAQGRLAKTTLDRLAKTPAKKAAKKNGVGHRTAVKRAPARKVAKRRAPAKPAKKRAPAKKAARRQPFDAERAPQARA